MSYLEKAVFSVLKYFSLFNYPPSFSEIYTFLPKKCSKEKLKKELERLSSKKIIKNLKFQIKNSCRYAVGGYGIKLKIKNEKLKIKEKTFFNNFLNRYQISQKKLKNWRFRVYIRLLFLFPQIKLVGLSGSLAMMNGEDKDDIDLFIITAKNRLFTGRFIAVFFAKIFGLYRSRFSSNSQLLSYKDKVCPNLFFDERDLEVPEFKKTEYVAHEVLQMKPLVAKGDIYQQFLTANRWVYKMFPNARLLSSKFKVQSSKLQFKIKNYLTNFKFLTVIFHFSFLIFNLIASVVEEVLKSLQLYFINRHRTTELILDYQLWFHPNDLGNQIRNQTSEKKIGHK